MYNHVGQLSLQEDESSHNINALRPRQNGCHVTDDVFKCIFWNENVWISLKISLKFVPKVPINNIPALVQIMAWRGSGDKPLSEAMMASLLMHICLTWTQWVKVIVDNWYYSTYSLPNALAQNIVTKSTASCPFTMYSSAHIFYSH